MKATILVAALVLTALCTAGAAADDADRETQIVTNSIGMKLVRVPAGSFLRGSPEDEPERLDEEHQHEVVISRPFYMGVYEVTQREFNRLMEGQVRRGAVFTEERGGGPDHPMDNATWVHAVQFCERLSELPEEQAAGRRYRLPTEAEWEYACRAGTDTPFHFGDALSSEQANFNGNFPYGGAATGPYLRRTAKVGSYPPNAWGLHDMHGNVAEWCSDYYDQDAYRNSPHENPTGPEQGVVSTDYDDYFRVVRGGSWLDEARACRSAFRFLAMPHEPNRLIGFRVVCDVAAEEP